LLLAAAWGLFWSLPIAVSGVLYLEVLDSVIGLYLVALYGGLGSITLRAASRAEPRFLSLFVVLELIACVLAFIFGITGIFVFLVPIFLLPALLTASVLVQRE
jgi:hypothetical protein